MKSVRCELCGCPVFYDSSVPLPGGRPRHAGLELCMKLLAIRVRELEEYLIR
jgi:hypothetical protein